MILQLVYALPLRWFVIAFSLALLSSCLSSNFKITGQVEMVPTDAHGDASIIDAGNSGAGITITEGDTFSIRLSSVFVRNVKESGGAEFLIYAEIYDIQPDDRQKLVKVIFKENNQAPGYLVNQRDRLVYGPIQFTGNPLRVRLFVVELDKEENEIVSDILKQAVQVASVFQPAIAPFSGAATTIGDLFLSLNQDDRELAFDFTLYPKTHSQQPYLQTGDIMLVKTENRARFLQTRDGRFDSWTSSGRREDVIYDEYGHRVDSTPEDYAAFFQYFAADHPLRGRVIRSVDPDGYSSIGYIQPHTVLRVMGSQVWIQSVALEYFPDDTNEPGKILLADARTGLATASEEEMGNLGFEIRKYKVGGVEYEELVAPDRIAIRLGQRVPYREKTHAVITVTNGGKAHDRALFEDLSKQDQQTLQEALQSDVSRDLLAQKLEAVSNSLIRIRVTRDVVSTVNNQFAANPAARVTPAFPLAYLRQLTPSTAEQGPAKNEAILRIVGSMVFGFPYTEADAANEPTIQTIRGLQAENFASQGDGTYVFVPPPTVSQ